MVTIRIRSIAWFVAGMALATATLWTTTWRADALPSPDESTTVNVPPERVLDSRDPTDLGLPGPFVSQLAQKLQITGSIPTATGTKTVVPTGATGVLLNVTGFNPTANGFISIRPGDATGAPTTSSLNLLAGETVPNAVQVSLPTSGPNAGQIDITYDALGIAGPTTDIFIDVVGYTTNTGLQDINTQLGQKANSTDVYGRADSDARYLRQGEIVMRHGAGAFGNPANNTTVGGNGILVTTGSGFVSVPITGPAQLGAVDYGLKSISYCVEFVAGPGFINTVSVNGYTDTSVGTTTVSDVTDRTTDGCHTLTVNEKTSTSFTIVFVLAGGSGGIFSIRSMTSTWAPTSQIP